MTIAPDRIDTGPALRDWLAAIAAGLALALVVRAPGWLRATPYASTGSAVTYAGLLDMLETPPGEPTVTVTLHGPSGPVELPLTRTRGQTGAEWSGQSKSAWNALRPALTPCDGLGWAEEW